MKLGSSFLANPLNQFRDKKMGTKVAMDQFAQHEKWMMKFTYFSLICIDKMFKSKKFLVPNIALDRVQPSPRILVKEWFSETQQE